MKRFLKHAWPLILLAFIAVCIGCGCTGINGAYVAADRQTYKAVAPLLEQTKKDRPALAPAITDTLRSWDIRLTEAEKATVIP